MRLLHFDPESNNHEGLKDSISRHPVGPGEVALLASGEAIDVLIHSISESFEAVSEEDFIHVIGVTPDQARLWRNRLAVISAITYLPQ